MVGRGLKWAWAWAADSSSCGGKLVSFSSNEMQNEQDHLPLLRQQHKVIFTKEYSFKFIFLFGICTL